MTDKKTTKLTIREDWPTGIASSGYGANINAMGFNIVFIAKRDPKLAVELIKLYDKAYQIREDDPFASDEDFILFTQTLVEFLSDRKEI